MRVRADSFIRRTYGCIWQERVQWEFWSKEALGTFLGFGLLLGSSVHLLLAANARGVFVAAPCPKEKMLYALQLELSLAR